jgi:hypothetical protein
MFYVGEWLWKLIICLLQDLKNDFCQLDEAMFQVVERPSKIILCIQGIEERDLDEVV